MLALTTTPFFYKTKEKLAWESKKRYLCCGSILSLVQLGILVFSFVLLYGNYYKWT